MKSLRSGRRISSIEVTNISRHGFWVLLDDKEYFLSFEKYPWFRDAGVSAILDIRLLHNRHLYWPGLDIDLSTDILDNPERYPLIFINP